MIPLRCVLFDLDGTLLDTLPDLAFALNAVRAEEGLEPLPLALIRPTVSHGARGMVRLGFGEDQDETTLQRRAERLIGIYSQHLAERTCLFDGVAEVLKAIQSQGQLWGVVTNKRRDLTWPLLKQLGLDKKAACVVCGDEVPRPKPHPEALWLACQRAQVEPTECVYVGDAQRDIEAGRCAGMRTLVALYGYLAEDSDPQSWGADGLVESPYQILAWLKTWIA